MQQAAAGLERAVEALEHAAVALVVEVPERGAPAEHGVEAAIEAISRMSPCRKLILMPGPAPRRRRD
jgi:hypothetical protein